jgi:L-ascorbate metabolism protein UlaG (beta-lactamase superfamily)
MKAKNSKIKYVFNKDLPILKKDWQGNVTINKQFHNTEVPEKSLLRKLLKWKTSRNPQKQEKKQENYALQVHPFYKLPAQKNTIIWLGHASFFISINGVKIITDPCFFDIPTAPRKAQMPCDIDILQDIDYLLISHDHRDHIDKKSVKMLCENNPKLEILTSLNMTKLIKSFKIPNIRIQEAGWYQSYQTNKPIEIIFVPARHWGRRAANDFNNRLWGGFLIKTPQTSIYFSGDTAYSSIFKDISDTFGNIDICLLPIGAYSPKYMMDTSHTTPEEAFQIFKDLGGKTMIPMHYGTYDLSDEPLGEPIKRLKKCFNADAILQELAVGAFFEY